MFAYVKNKFIPIKQASLSIKERGFMFGDGVFETMLINNYLIYNLEFHLTRIKNSLNSIYIDVSIQDLQEKSYMLIKKNNQKNGILRLSISRGIGNTGFLPNNCKPTIIIETFDLKKTTDNFVDLYISSYRKIPNISLPNNGKLMNGLNSILARMEAQNNKCFEAILLNMNENIADCSSSNIFIYKNGVIYTPSNSCGAMNGSIKSRLLTLSPYEIKESVLDLLCLCNADEVFITNISWKILPVRSISTSSSNPYCRFDSRKISDELKMLITADILGKKHSL